MSVIAIVTARRISPNKGVDLAVPKIYNFDTAQLARQMTNTKRGGCVIKLLDSARKSVKVEIYENLDRLNVACDPNATNNPQISDLNLAVAAAGTTQGAGTAIIRYLNRVTSATAASAEAVTLPVAPAVGDVYVIVNAATAIVKVFPGVGGTINGGSANASVNLAIAARAHYVCTALLTWVTAV